MFYFVVIIFVYKLINQIIDSLQTKKTIENWKVEKKMYL